MAGAPERERMMSATGIGEHVGQGVRPSSRAAGSPRAWRAVRRGAMLAAAALALLAGRAEAQQIYRWQISNGASAGGTTTSWSAACGATLDGRTTARITTMDASAFGCAGASITDSTLGDVDPYHTFLTVVRSTPYAAATFVTGRTFLARLTNSTTTVRTADFQL